MFTAEQLCLSKVLVNNPACRPDPSCLYAVQPEISYLNISPGEKYPHDTKKCPMHQDMKTASRQDLTALQVRDWNERYQGFSHRS
jgi:hypothetical protein